MKFISALMIVTLPVMLLSCGGKNLAPGGSGMIEATEVVFSAETNGQLKALYFDEGDKIKPGDTVGMIDTVTVMLRLREAEAMKQAAQTRLQAASIGIEQADYNLTLAKKNFDRVSDLIKSGSANQQQYDQLETAYKQADLARKQASASYSAAQADLANIAAQIDLLKKQLNDCFPVSPVSGTVTNKYVEAGELIGIGKQLLKIAELDTVWVKVYLPPGDLTRFRLGSPATINPEDGRTAPLSGRVTWISDVAEFTPKNVETKEARADLVYAVKVTVANSEGVLKIGMPVSVEIQ